MTSDDNTRRMAADANYPTDYEWESVMTRLPKYEARTIENIRAIVVELREQVAWLKGQNAAFEARVEARSPYVVVGGFGTAELWVQACPDWAVVEVVVGKAFGDVRVFAGVPIRFENVEETHVTTRRVPVALSSTPHGSNSA